LKTRAQHPNFICLVTEERAMKAILLGTGMAVMLAVASVSPVEAGCFKGAVVGAVAGHYAHHHAILGAIAGCAVGHHLAVKAREQKAAQAAQASHPAQASQSH
jgi:hypothetical protein